MQAPPRSIINSYGKIYMIPVKNAKGVISEYSTLKKHKNCKINKCVNHKKDYVVVHDIIKQVEDYVFNNPNNKSLFHNGFNSIEYIVSKICLDDDQDRRKLAVKALKNVDNFQEEISNIEVISCIFDELENNEEEIIELLKKVKSTNIYNFIVTTINRELFQVYKYLITRNFEITVDILLTISVAKKEYFKELFENKINLIQGDTLFSIFEIISFLNNIENIDIFIDITFAKFGKCFFDMILFQAILNKECKIETIDFIARKADYKMHNKHVEAIFQYRNFEEIVFSIPWCNEVQKTIIKNHFKLEIINKPTFSEMVTLGKNSMKKISYKYVIDVNNSEIENSQEFLKKIYGLILH